MVLKPEPERQMLVYQKTMFEHCINSFCHLKTLEKRLEKYYNGSQNHEGFIGFENACCRAKSYVILMSLNYVHFNACYC